MARRSSRLAQAKTESNEPIEKVEKVETVKEKKEKPVKKEKESNGKRPADSEASSEISVGDQIPDLTLLDQDGNSVSLRKLDTRFVVIFAYPKASTPGCTRQACGFQKNYQFLKSKDVTVLGLSADKPTLQKTFATKQGLQYPLLSDPSRELIGVLGAKKLPTGIKRSHWVFVDGVLRVKLVQISPEASVDNAKAEVESFIKGSE